MGSFVKYSVLFPLLSKLNMHFFCMHEPLLIADHMRYHAIKGYAMFPDNQFTVPGSLLIVLITETDHNLPAIIV